MYQVRVKRSCISVSDTTRVVNTQSDNGSRLLQGKVTQVETKRGFYGQEIKSFSIMANDREVLVTLPKRITLSFAVESEVWVTGDRAGPLRVHADIVFLPQLQQGIDLRVKNRLPVQSVIGMVLFYLMVLFQNPTLVLFYIAIPVAVVYGIKVRWPVRPTLCSYRNWEFIEEQVTHPEKKLLDFKYDYHPYLLEKTILGIGGVFLIMIDVNMSLIPLATMFSHATLPYDFLLSSLIMNALLLAALLSLTIKIISDVLLGVGKLGK